MIIDIETLFQNLSDSVQYHEDAAVIVYKECIDSGRWNSNDTYLSFLKKYREEKE